MILDIVFAAIMIFSIVWGFKKGLVRSVCNVFSFILSVIVAFLLYSPITEFITASPLGVFISDKITGSVKMPQVDLSTVPEFLHKPFEAVLGTTSETVSILTGDFARVIIGIISVIITIIAVKLLISLVFKLFNVFAKLPVIKQFNGILGGAFGVVSGYFWVCILAIAVTYISVIPNAEFVKNLAEGSKIAAFIGENNFILEFISGAK